MEIKTLPDYTVTMLDLIDLLMDDEPLLHAADVNAPTPGADNDKLPWPQAYVYDGDADQTSGVFVVDVAFFADTYTEASRLARAFDARFMRYPHRVGSVLLDRVGTVSIPTEIPWIDDNSIRRFQATYSVSFRR